MISKTYLITGQVIDRDNGLGAPDLKLEAWDSNIQRNKLLGKTMTNENGRFSISFDLREIKYETPPDLFFKVYRNRILLESTESSVLWNANTQESVTINIRTVKERAPGKDRITSDQVFKGVDFIQKSDFKGVFREYRAKMDTNLGFVTDMVVNTFTNMDIEPLTVKGSKQSDVINQDVAIATQNLKSKNVEVKEVLQYRPGLNRESVNNITSLNVKPGQQVNLYEEDGKVRYYTVVKTGDPVNAEIAKNIEGYDIELKKLQAELKATQENTAKKDEQINSMKRELEALRKDHVEINTMLKSKSFKKFIIELKKNDLSTGSKTKLPK